MPQVPCSYPSAHPGCVEGKFPEPTIVKCLCRYAEQNRSAGWDAEWVHAYSQYEEQQRQQEDRENSDFFAGSAGYGRTFNRSDPMGFYKVLGVEPGASKQEIQVLAHSFFNLVCICECLQ